MLCVVCCDESNVENGAMRSTRSTTAKALGSDALPAPGQVLHIWVPAPHLVSASGSPRLASTVSYVEAMHAIPHCVGQFMVEDLCAKA